MRLTLARMAFAAVLAGTILAGATPAIAQLSGEKLVIESLVLKDADLLTATQVLSQKTGLQFVFKATDQEYKRITLQLSNLTAEDALKYICDAAGAYYSRDENGVFVISREKPEPPKVDLPANLPTNVAAGVRLHKFKMVHADAQDVMQQIRYGIALDPMKGFVEMDRMQNYLTRSRSSIGTGTPLSNIQFVGSGPNSAGQTFSPVSSSQNNFPVATGNETGNGVRLPGEFAGQGALGEGGGGQPGGAAGGGGGAQGQLEPGGLIPEGIQFITFDPTDNSIIVRGTDEEIRQLQEAISFFDVAPKQVQIKVEFITTSRSIARALGFDWLYSRGGVFLGVQPGSFASAGDPIFFNWASGNVTTRLRALLQEGQGKVVNAPVLRTLNNQAASVQQGVQTWIFLNQVIAIGNGNVITQSIPVPVSVQTVLNVRPRINNDGTIAMTLNPSISDLGQIRRGPDGSEVPDILFQNIGIATRVKNGETIALAGMTRKSETGSQARFPILGDLPIIGQFFRSTRKEVNNTELLIFVTPTIIEDDSIGGIGP